MARNLTLDKVKGKLDITDFRNITKGKLWDFFELIPEMDPDVAKKAIEQIPQFVEMSIAALSEYKEVALDAIEKNNESVARCYEIFYAIEESLNACLSQEDISFEEKKYYIDKMLELSKMVEQLDKNNKEFLLKAFGIPAVVISFITVVLFSVGRTRGSGKS